MANGWLRDCKWLIKDHNLDLICHVETKLSLESSCSLFHSKALRLFPLEDDYNSLSYTRKIIYLKCKSSKVSFEVIISTTQIIHGVVKVNSYFLCFISCIYAHNNAIEIKQLWDLIWSIADSTAPLILFMDFNCILYSMKKLEKIVFSSYNDWF